MTTVMNYYSDFSRDDEKSGDEILNSIYGPPSKNYLPEELSVLPRILSKEEKKVLKEVRKEDYIFQKQQKNLLEEKRREDFLKNQAMQRQLKKDSLEKERIAIADSERKEYVRKLRETARIEKRQDEINRLEKYTITKKNIFSVLDNDSDTEE